MQHEPQTPSISETLREGIEHLRAGRLTAAEQACQQVLQKTPDHPDALHLLGVIAHLHGHHERCVELITEALVRAPSSPYFLNSLGEGYRALLRPEEALACYDKALTIAPDFVEALTNRGIVLQTLKRHAEALASFDHALVIKQGYSQAIFSRAVTLQEFGRAEEALSGYNRVLEAAPEHLEALNNRGNVLRQLRRHNEALASYDKALAIRPNFAEILNNRCLVLFDLGRYEEALSSCDKAIAAQPAFADPFLNRGNILRELKRHGDALASYERALAVRPGFPEALIARGQVLQAIKRHAEAIASFDAALSTDPDNVHALNNRGNALQELMRHEQALACYDRAVSIKPDFAEALHNRGYALLALKRYEEALTSYVEARTIDPDFDFLHGILLHTKMQLCDWSDFDHERSGLIGEVSAGKKVSPPLPVLALVDSLALQRKAAEIWVQTRFPAVAPPRFARHLRRKKIRLAYFSSDFRQHPVSMLSAPLFDTHDRDRFQVIAFSTGPDTKDEMRKRLERAFDRFLDVKDSSDTAIADQARRLEIDVAVDLGGHTKDSRFGVFANRAAPIQVSYLGYLGTTGAQFIDYLVGDALLVPAESRQHYTEKIAYLPTYQALDAKRKVSQPPTRREAGLPDAGFVYCCFNNSYKITPPTFDAWMRILKSVERSILWLYGDSDLAASNLRRHAERHGVEAHRLVFAGHLPQPDHLARYRTADLFLDTLPCNAGATASDALGTGLPVLTCTGEAFASRVAASVLRASDLPELVTSTPAEYEALAIQLGNDPSRAKSIKKKLEKNRLRAPLFDTKLFTQHIEDAYTQMYERNLRGLPPDHLFVKGR